MNRVILTSPDASDLARLVDREVSRHEAGRVRMVSRMATVWNTTRPPTHVQTVFLRGAEDAS